MKKVGIFYGSTTGNTQSVAKQIAAALGVDGNNVVDISNASVDQMLGYDVLLLGSSTWGAGDLQDEWEGFVDELKSANLSGKEVAVFGTGDSASYSDTFCDALGTLAAAAEQAGAKLVGGNVATSGYSFDSSTAVRGDAFCGLPIDEDNESNKTGERVKQWAEQLKSDCGL